MITRSASSFQGWSFRWVCLRVEPDDRFAGTRHTRGPSPAGQIVAIWLNTIPATRASGLPRPRRRSATTKRLRSRAGPPAIPRRSLAPRAISPTSSRPSPRRRHAGRPLGRSGYGYEITGATPPRTAYSSMMKAAEKNGNCSDPRACEGLVASEAPGRLRHEDPGRGARGVAPPKRDGEGRN